MTGGGGTLNKLGFELRFGLSESQNLKGRKVIEPVAQGLRSCGAETKADKLSLGIS